MTAERLMAVLLSLLLAAWLMMTLKHLPVGPPPAPVQPVPSKPAPIPVMPDGRKPVKPHR